MIDLQAHKNHIEYEKAIVNIATATEKGKTYRMINDFKYSVTKVRIDGGVFTQTLCCDFLFLTRTVTNNKFKNESAYLIELKGTNVKHAIDQIESTIKKLKFTNKEFILKARIVAAKGIPLPLRPANCLTLDERLRKQGGDLLCKTNLLEERV